MTRCIEAIHIFFRTIEQHWSSYVNLNCFKTHIDYKPGLSEYHGLRPVGRNVSVELLAIAIPLDGVERVALQVVGALQDHVLSPDGVRGDGLLS